MVLVTTALDNEWMNECKTRCVPVGWSHTMYAPTELRIVIAGVKMTAARKHTTTNVCLCFKAYIRYYSNLGWLSGTMVERRSLTGELSLSCSWRVTTYVGKPSAVGQPTRPTQPFKSSQVFVYLTGMSECRPVHRTMLHNKNSNVRIKQYNNGISLECEELWY